MRKNMENDMTTDPKSVMPKTSSVPKKQAEPGGTQVPESLGSGALQKLCKDWILVCYMNMV